MNTIQEKVTGDVPFSRRYTLHEIWKYLDEKYPEARQESALTRPTR